MLTAVINTTETGTISIYVSLNNDCGFLETSKLFESVEGGRGERERPDEC
jgi:hypothetical protein